MSVSFYKLIVVLSVLLFSTSKPHKLQHYESPPSDTLATKYSWTQLTPDAGFSKSYNFQLFSDDQYIWAFHHDGVWLSKDGITWWKTELTDIVNRQAFLDYVNFKGAIYALGTFAGNIEHYTQTTQIAKTSDYKSWDSRQYRPSSQREDE